MTKLNLNTLADIIAQDDLVEAVRIDGDTLMITPVIRDRRSTHRLQGVMFRAIRKYGVEGAYETDTMQRPPVVKKRVYINKRNPNAKRFSHYEHNEWSVTLRRVRMASASLTFDPFNPRRHLNKNRKAA